MADVDGARAIRDGERHECLEMLDRAFGGTPNGYFVRYFDGDPWYLNDYCRVYSLDGRIVSALHICRREVRLGSARLIMGGVADVGTDPSERGKGYSTAVLRDAIRTMNEDEMDFSVLYTGIYDFYARLGWRKLPTPRLVGRLKAQPGAAPDPRYRIRPYIEDVDAAALLHIYDQFNAERPTAAVRTEPYWRDFVMHRFHAPWRILMAEDESGPVAYCMSSSREQELAFDEVGFLPGHRAALSSLALEVAHDALRGGAERVCLEPASDPGVTAVGWEIAEYLEIQPRPYTMILLLDPLRTFSRLLPELQRRVVTGNLSGSAAIQTEVGSVAITADGSRLELVGESKDEETAHLTQADLARMLFGMGPTEDPESELTPGAARFLNRLFPSQPFVYWEADKF